MVTKPRKPPERCAAERKALDDLDGAIAAAEADSVDPTLTPEQKREILRQRRRLEAKRPKVLGKLVDCLAARPGAAPAKKKGGPKKMKSARKKR